MFKPPPRDIDRRQPLFYTTPDSEIWWRSYPVGKSPIFFGKNKSQRWDAPAKDYGVLYLGADAHCAFMESIGRGVLKTRFVPASTLKKRGIAKVRFKIELRLVDLVTSGGLTRLGTDGSLPNGLGYGNSQRWSQALRSHPSKSDGIYYRSRFDQARAAAALFDQCEPSVEVTEDLGSWAGQPALLGEILDHYGFGTDL